MAGAEFYAIRTLKKYQHYKDRNPPWVKLYASLLSDPDFASISDGAKWFFLASTLLASRYDNRIPLRAAWLWGQTGSKSAGAVVAYIDELKSIQLIELCGASKSLADRKQNAMPETETETETEQNKVELTARRISSRGVVHALFDFWRWWTEKRHAQATEERLRLIERRLAEGYAPLTVVRAIVGCCSNPFNRGENERGKQYVDLTLICRSGSKLEGYADDVKEAQGEREIARFRVEFPDAADQLSPLDSTGGGARDGGLSKDGKAVLPETRQ